jgi:TolB-like protein/Flp pilus assembly protein TadD
MTDLFVSYKAEDRRRVQPLVDALLADGYSVWWDAEIGGGDEWRDRIQQELDLASCVLVVWSKRSVAPEGKFVRDEANRAQRRDVYLPVRIDKVDPPLGFGETQAIPLIGWRGSRSDPRYSQLLAAIRAIRSGKPLTRNGSAHAARGFSRRGIIGASAVAAACAAGAGAWLMVNPGRPVAGNSIAVLPFANLSGDPSQAYFSDGIAEEIRSALARIGLQVAGRTSSEAAKADGAQAIAKKLGVANILAGSVRRSPSTIRVSAQLIKGSDGLERWSQDYDRPSGDVLTIQSDIAQSVAQALSIALGSDTKARLTIGGTANPAAQDLYLKGFAQAESEDSAEGLGKAIQLYDAAITLDPNYALAYGAKAAALTELTGSFPVKDKPYDFTAAAELARRAIKLQPGLADAHGVLAYALLNSLDLAGAASEFAKALSLPGTDVIILVLYGGFLTVVGDEDAALGMIRQARLRDPLNADVYSIQANAFDALGRHAEAIVTRREALRLGPARALDRVSLAYSLILLGKAGEAYTELAKLPSDFFGRLTAEAILSARRGNLAECDRAIQRLDQLYGDTANYQLAQIYAQRGEREGAFAALNRALSLRDPGLLTMRTDNFLRPLWGDRRFDQIERKLNFTRTPS